MKCKFIQTGGVELYISKSSTITRKYEIDFILICLLNPPKYSIISREIYHVL